jgi:hypothetical protein
VSLQTEQSSRSRQAAERETRDRERRRWERMRAGGRSAFVWRSGVAGWGLPAALVTGAYKVIQEQGLGWPPELTDGLRTALVLIALVFPALGYVFGGWLWAQGEARYARLRQEAGEPETDDRPATHEQRES